MLKLLSAKDKQIKEQSAALIDQTKTISDFGSKFAQLADQLQKLNLLDKPQKEQPTQTKKRLKMNWNSHTVNLDIKKI